MCQTDLERLVEWPIGKSSCQQYTLIYSLYKYSVRGGPLGEAFMLVSGF